MDVEIDKTKRFVCVDYPAVVENETKMLETLGGEKNVTNTYNDPVRRLELRWRPEDWYCKPTCGDRHRAIGLLLRVRRRRKRDLPGVSTVKDDEKYKVEAVGIVDTMYKFNGMADFQYLAMERQKDDVGNQNEEPGTYHSLLDQLMIKKLEERSWMNKPAPLFLPPPLFSRIDNPYEYAFRDVGKHNPSYKDPMKNQPPHLIGITRQRRPHYTVFVNFEDKEIPNDPYPQAAQKMETKLRDKDVMEKIKQERPVWSKNALKAHISLTGEQFKYCLPVVAYYFVTGPWRSLWVRLGYDPRKDPGAKKYQLVDFRVRQRSAAEKLRIIAKRSTYAYKLPNTVVKTNLQPSLIQQHMLGDVAVPQPPEESSQEAIYKFRPGLVPAYRQMFYQLCDIEEPEIQMLLDSNDGKETECTEREGWCVQDMQDKCRQIIARHLRKILNKEKTTLSDSNEPKSSTSQESFNTGEDMDVEEEGDEAEEGEEVDEVEEDGDDNEMETEMLDMEYDFDPDQGDGDTEHGGKPP